MPPSKFGRCCRSLPRCKSCPVFRAAEVAHLRDRLRLESETPPHLRGVPESLRKYEPLLRAGWERRRAEEDAAAGGEHVA